jgi:NAD(P)H-dependent flavin oxidoreductase YrpB (nitropropane dioxygenase family)
LASCNSEATGGRSSNGDWSGKCRRSQAGETNESELRLALKVARTGGIGSSQSSDENTVSTDNDDDDDDDDDDIFDIADGEDIEFEFEFEDEEYDNVSATDIS